jgi:hypothetical protein
MAETTHHITLACLDDDHDACPHTCNSCQRVCECWCHSDGTAPAQSVEGARRMAADLTRTDARAAHAEARRALRVLAHIAQAGVLSPDDDMERIYRELSAVNAAATGALALVVFLADVAMGLPEGPAPVETGPRDDTDTGQGDPRP